MPTITTGRAGRTLPCPDPPQPTLSQTQHAFFDLDAEPTSPRRARTWTRTVLGDWQLADLADDAESVVGELVANALHATAGQDQPAARLALNYSRGRLAILVKDDSPVLPRAQRPAENAESGRGLLMVEALSDRLGWYPLDGGKVVWAVLCTLSATPPPPGSPQAPAWPDNDQPGRRRGRPMVGHAGQPATDGPA